MFYLTHQERKVLLAVGILILCGSVIRFSGQTKAVTNADNQNYINFPSREPAHFKPININTASRQELEKIPGVGPTIANRILDYRLRFGPFKTWESLKNIKGIGDKKLEAIKDYIIF
jgi:comEA protein